VLTYHHTVNPHNKTHGAPDDEERHVGDLGNFKTDGQGNAQGSTSDKLIKLIGSESVIGVCLSPPHPHFSLTDYLHSAPLSCTPVLTTSARADTRSPRRLVTLELVLRAVSLVSPTRLSLCVNSLGTGGRRANRHCEHGVCCVNRCK
jgi:hypothetical protein